MKEVAIIGGGLAGLAAAIQLCDAGCKVTLIETRKKLGGRATSFVDPRTGEVLDNCQHVLMGCCTNLLDLYDRLGVLDLIEWHRELYWTRGGGKIDTLKAGILPAPLHFTRSMHRMKIFTRHEKRAIARAMWRMIRLGAKGRSEWSNRTFKAFLESCNQPERVVRDFWNTIIISACNLSVERVSAAYAMQVFQQGFLAEKWSYTIGLPTVPLWRLYDPAVKRIEKAGGRILLSTSAKAISFDGSRVTGIVTADGIVEAAAVVAAVPFDRLDRLISEPMRAADARLQTLDQLAVSPILGVHLRFDQPVMPPELPHLILVDHGVHWLFNKGMVRDSGVRASSADPEHATLGDSHQHLHAVISGANEWMGLSEDEIVRRVVDDIHDALPNSIGLEPIEARAVKEKRATFAAVPSIDTLRPSAGPGTVGLGGGGIANLFLAGDWCDTGWPATMEGAVRSGYAAAAALTGEGGLVGEVPTGRFAHVLGLR